MSQKEALEFIQKRINEFGADDFFSLKEWNYLHNEDPKESEKISYSWQYENLYVMEWALGLIDGPLDFPDHFCAVAGGGAASDSLSLHEGDPGGGEAEEREGTSRCLRYDLLSGLGMHRYEDAGSSRACGNGRRCGL